MSPSDSANVHRYTPGFVTRDEEDGDHVRADNFDQLLAIPWVASWQRNYPNETFYRFSISRSPHQDMLMAEFNGGTKWWVVCHLDEPDLYSLPTWDEDGSATKISYERAIEKERERQEWLKTNPPPDPAFNAFSGFLKGLYADIEDDLE